MAVKLQLGNSNPEALASCLANLELRFLGSQAGAWEPANQQTSKPANQQTSKPANQQTSKPAKHANVPVGVTNPDRHRS